MRKITYAQRDLLIPREFKWSNKVQGGAIITESFFKKISAILGTVGNIGTFGDIRTDKKFLSKIIRMSVRNYVIILKVFDSIKSFTIGPKK